MIQRRALRLLTDKEIEEFVQGAPQSQKNKDVYLDTVLAIDSLPYDTKYEIQKLDLDIGTKTK